MSKGYAISIELFFIEMSVSWNQALVTLAQRNDTFVTKQNKKNKIVKKT